MTPGEFLAGYAERSRTTPAAILELGRVVVACACGDEICLGWQLVPADCLNSWEKAEEL